MKKAFFITSTGTGIGKTLVTTSLCFQLKKAGKSVNAIKPVISGFDENDPECDTLQIIKSLGEKVTDENISQVSPWRFKAPISPNMAAKLEGREISLKEFSAFCLNSISMNFEFTLIEGAGGVLAPINDREAMLEVAKELDIPCLLVVGSYLGTISHTLTALESISHRGLKTEAIIISESAESPVSLLETAETIENFSGIKPVSLPRINTNNSKWTHSNYILKALNI